MGGELVQFAGSLVAVGLIILLAKQYGFSGTPELDETEARAVVDTVTGGFAASRIGVGRNGAVLADETGRIAIVVPSGAHFHSRLLAPGAEARADGDRLVVRDGPFSATIDLGPSAGHWAREIARLG